MEMRPRPLRRSSRRSSGRPDPFIENGVDSRSHQEQGPRRRSLKPVGRTFVEFSHPERRNRDAQSCPQPCQSEDTVSKIQWASARLALHSPTASKVIVRCGQISVVQVFATACDQCSPVATWRGAFSRLAVTLPRSWVGQTAEPRLTSRGHFPSGPEAGGGTGVSLRCSQIRLRAGTWPLRPERWKAGSRPDPGTPSVDRKTR